MSIKKSFVFIAIMLFILTLASCNASTDGDIVLNRPTGLACNIPNPHDGATIRWNAVSSATGYRIFIDDVEVATTDSNWFHFKYEESDNYSGKTCTIQAFNNKGGISLISSGLIIPDKTPVTVQKVNFYFTVTKKVDNSMLIEWQDVDAVKYEIYINNKKIYETEELSYSLTAEEVFMFNDQSLSIVVVEESEKVDFIPTEYKIVAPVLIVAPTIKASNDAEGNFKISWNAVEGAISYNIYIDGAQYAYNVLDLEYTFHDSPDFTGKIVTVRAVDVYGRTSVFSNGCEYNNAINKPHIEGVVLENGDIQITWNEIKYAEKYLLYWRNKYVSEEYTKIELKTNSYVLSKEKLLKDSEMCEVYVQSIDSYGNESKKSNVYKWQIELAKPNIYLSMDYITYTEFLWDKVDGAVLYEVYVNGELYASVKTNYCKISNYYLIELDEKRITLVAVSKQGIKSEVSKEYVLK
ncbi:MAG: hypothetical protein IJX78_00905 [Bacilli bacterium]|nr:hypothetical protein [Bacilli bacterium]